MYNLELEDVFKAYFDCRKHKRRTKPQLEFEVNLEDNIIQLWRELKEGTYEIGASTCFCVSLPKKREVFAASFRDRIVHHLIMQRLSPLFEEEFIEDNYNCRVNKGVLYGVGRLKEKLDFITEDYTKDAWVAKFDIKGFFMSIQKDKLNKMLLDFIDERYTNKDDIDFVKNLVTDLVLHKPQHNCLKRSPPSAWNGLPQEKSLFTCGNNKGLAIGNLTSQHFANFYLNQFDHWMTSEFDGLYGRYVDDFYIISRDKNHILEIVPKIRKYLKETLGLTLSDKKIYIQPAHHGIKFIGSVVKKDRVYLGNQTVSNILNKISYYNHHVSKKNAENFVQTLNSYLGLFRHTRSFNLKQKILKMINIDWWAYIRLSDDMNKVTVINTL